MDHPSPTKIAVPTDEYDALYRVFLTAEVILAVLDRADGLANVSAGDVTRFRAAIATYKERHEKGGR